MNKFIFLFISILLLAFNNVKASELPYDYSSTVGIPITLTPVDYITTKDNLVDGSTIKFRSLTTVTHNGRTIINKGQIVEAVLEMQISSGMNGFPAELIIDDFKIPGIKESQLLSTYVKTGQNRCYLVFPLKWALTFLPPTGSLTNFIKGGHAKLKPGKPVTIYYYPEWK